MSQHPLLYERFAHGKLLITGEYVVLDGATAYAIPTQAGQWLRVFRSNAPHWLWEAYDEQGRLWFSAAFEANRDNIAINHTTHTETAGTLRQLLQLAGAADQWCEGLLIQTQLTFNRAWGWGSSSTLVALVAQWLGADPYILLDQTFGGSGYDIACAHAAAPILYRRGTAAHPPYIAEQQKHPILTDYGYIVWLGHKQNSRSAIAHYKQRRSQLDLEVFDNISKRIAASTDFDETAYLLHTFETHLAPYLHKPTIQAANFRDFDGVVKSLGAWGGDCVLALSKMEEAEVRTYFARRGFNTVLPVAHTLMPA